MGEGVGAPGAALRVGRKVGGRKAREGGAVYSRVMVRAICGRAGAGESLASICADPAMPELSVVKAWAARWPQFAVALRQVRFADGGPASGSRSSYCLETAQAIFRRLCDGEGVVAICADPLMPAYSTVWKWKQDFPAFAEAVAMAREIHAERTFEQGQQICDGVTPGTAAAARVQLTHLRWQAGKLAPKAYGPTKPVAPPEPAPELTLLIRRFQQEIGADGVARVVSYCPDPVTRQMVREE
jgi:hypothetical protein